MATRPAKAPASAGESIIAHDLRSVIAIPPAPPQQRHPARAALSGQPPGILQPQLLSREILRAIATEAARW